MSLYDDYMAEEAFAYNFPFGLPGSVWHAKSGDYKVTEMTDRHIRSCMRIVGKDDAWYRYFAEELERRMRDGAHWLPGGYCSKCNNRSVIEVDGEEVAVMENIKEWKYCPFCGARMVEEE